jgi:hypothetical protein
VGRKVLEPAEIGRHDEILQSVVAHNARRRVQRARAARARRFARITSRLAVVAAVGVGIYALVVVVSGAFGGGKSASHAPAATPAVTTAASHTKPATAAKPSRTKPAQHHVAKTTVHKKTAVHPPATASIASVSPTKTKTVKRHAVVAKTATTTKTKPVSKPKPSAGARAVVVAEADAAKGTRATSREATIPDPTVATFTISATRGSSFVEVRLKTSSGPLLTKGPIPKGETISFSNKALWVKVYAPGRLDLSVNGRPWRPSGSTVTATLTPTGVS